MRYATDGERIHGFGSAEDRTSWLAEGQNRRSIPGTSREVKKAIYENRVVFVEAVPSVGQFTNEREKEIPSSV